MSKLSKLRDKIKANALAAKSKADTIAAKTKTDAKAEALTAFDTKIANDPLAVRSEMSFSVPDIGKSNEWRP